tara:strand:- start:92 stop:292 length:201 start_codon:yes stop_codon:yes gene_type:complete
MMSSVQIEGVLKQCEKVHAQYEQLDMAGDEGVPYFMFMRNKGWCEALRLVLEVNGPSQIKEKPLDD